MMEIGAKKTVEAVVTEEMLACSMGSGDAEVFATPGMVAMMEKAAFLLLQESLPEGETSVGTALNVQHTRATLPGMRVTACAELVEAEGRRFRFLLTAWDEAGPIGEGTHERCRVTAERFIASAQARRDAAQQNG